MDQKEKIEISGANIKDVLFKIRYDMGISRHEAADKSGVSRQRINYWEVGRCAPSLDLLEQLLKSYGYRIVIEKMEEEK